MEVSDKQLLDLFSMPNKRREAFDTLIRQYQHRVYGVVRQMVIDHDDADDVVQEVFIKVWKNIDNFKVESGLFTWVYRIASNEALQFLRKKRRRFLLTGDFAKVMQEQVTLGIDLDGEEIQLKLQKAVLTLPDKQRLIFNFKYYEDLKYEEISKITGKTVGNLKANYHHAVKKIEKYLQDH